ncbi:MAG: alginate export family protein [Myxococcota bacterium]
MTSRPTPRPSTLALILLAAAVFLTGPSLAHAQWTLTEALLPDALFLHVAHRTRYEFLNDEFRAGRNGDTDIVAFRTLIHAGVKLPYGLTVGAELQDSRAEQNADTRLNTGIVNAAELLRAYIAIERPEVRGGTFKAQAGRITMDLGSRRLVARNRYRNTINGFTGIDLEWQGTADAGNPTLRGFWTLPVQRKPGARKRALDNDAVFDNESLDQQFWGLFAARDLGVLGRGEIYFLGLHESDLRHRELYTPGFRLFKKAAKNAFDYTIETAVQFGESRTSSSATRNLNHLAHFHHVTVGYTFDALASPRIALQYDYASGDENPNDGSNERFDTLFGARRFEWGPTGIYGPFARANLHTPGIRIQAKPHARLTTFVAYRGYWLASDQDAWTVAGVRDATGRANDFVGSQFEIRGRFQVIPGNVMLEAGYAHLFAGDFIDEAPNSNGQGDSDYVYTQIKIDF